MHSPNKKEFEALLSSLENCFQKTVRRNISPLAMKSYANDNNTVLVGSIGKFVYCVGYIDPVSANKFDKLYSDVSVAADLAIKITSAVRLDIHGSKKKKGNCVTENTNSTRYLPNLDRIDQARLPLNGKYNYPGTAGSGVNVYIVDTGINIQNLDFEGRATHGGSFCAGCPNTDDHGHGTNVAGIVGGKIFGVAKKVRLIAIKAFDAGGHGSTSDLIMGLSFIANEHIKSTKKKTVVNMSVRFAFSNTINAAVDSLTSMGIHVVVAAGNEAGDACLVSPASALTAIAVGATDPSTDRIASFSNKGKCVDIFAPGVNIVSDGIGSNTDILVQSGTSQATPHVSGTVALIIAQSGNRTPAQMKIEINKLSTKNVVIGLDSVTPNRFLRVPFSCCH
jgi:subtilisin family serine protease